MTDPIAIFEAAYSLAGDEHDWLAQLGETTQKQSDDNRWLVARTYDANGKVVTTRAMACCGCDEVGANASAAQLFAPLVDPEAHGKPLSAENVPYLQKNFLSTLRQFPAGYRKARVDERRVREFEHGLKRWLRRWDLADELWVNAQDPTGIGCCVVAPMRRRGPLSPREIHRWSCVAAHIATAFRIRRQFAGSSGPATSSDLLDAAEAIFHPGGRLEHAERPAQGDSALAALRRAVRALDRARGSLRRRDPQEAMTAWHALVVGRWSLLDHFDADGRRFVVAHRNDASVPDARGLTLRERQVLAYVALGHSNKMIAYELGLSLSTVASHLTLARTKLRLPSGAALQRESDDGGN